ncbi:MAG: hypothetical protein MUF49_26400 [Oculatellaceae cyanobacterium Prado106]|jgi:hypothetical protein|nr:hypothetical protein [Oculatellaceae cyanobacterium Prado106]
MSVLEIISQVAQVTTVISVVLAVLSIRESNRVNRRQWNVDVFTTYAERYDEVVKSFPGNTFLLRFQADQLPPQSDELTLCILRYLYVAAEIHYLAQANYMEEEVAQVWRQQVQLTLKSPLVVREWPSLKEEFKAIPRFYEMFEEMHMKPIQEDDRDKP